MIFGYLIPVFSGVPIFIVIITQGMIINGYWEYFKSKELLLLATVCSHLHTMVVPIKEKSFTYVYVYLLMGFSHVSSFDIIHHHTSLMTFSFQLH